MCQYFNDYLISLLYFKGGAQISLADFNVQTPVRFRWYNLLSCAVSKIQQQQLSLSISKFLSQKINSYTTRKSQRLFEAGCVKNNEVLS